MIKAPKCWKRHCKFYIGIKNDDDCELHERPHCHYYEDGIPSGISYGNDDCEYYKPRLGAEPDPEDEPEEEERP